jgi:hypothetical protein
VRLAVHASILHAHTFNVCVYVALAPVGSSIVNRLRGARGGVFRFRLLLWPDGHEKEDAKWAVLSHHALRARFLQPLSYAGYALGGVDMADIGEVYQVEEPRDGGALREVKGINFRQPEKQGVLHRSMSTYGGAVVTLGADFVAIEYFR